MLVFRFFSDAFVIGEIIGIVQATDVEQTSGLTYNLVQSDDFLDFRVNAQTGVISATRTFAFDLDRHNYQIEV